MDRPAPASVLCALVALVLLLAGCGSSGQNTSAPSYSVKDPFAYNRSRPLDAHVSGTAVHGPVDVRSLSYTTFDGSRVPALLAVPRGKLTAGCLMYQPGVGQAKEVAAPLWPGAAKLGLAMFTIDARGTGARSNGPLSINDALHSADLLVELLRGDVIDLRRGLDYLEKLPLCHHNVGYLGTSEGAIIGVLLSGTDPRIRAAVLTSIGATWRARMFYSPFILPGITTDPPAFQAALTELSPFDPAHWIAKISPRPVMIVDGLSDPSVPPIDALDLAAAARQPKTLVLHQGGHDPFSGPQAAFVARKVGEFLTANLVHHRAGSG